MATRQLKTVTKTAPAARSNPIRKTTGKPKAAPAVLKLATTKAANKERTATSAPSLLTGPLGYETGANLRRPSGCLKD